MGYAFYASRPYAFLGLEVRQEGVDIRCHGGSLCIRECRRRAQSCEQRQHDPNEP